MLVRRHLIEWRCSCGRPTKSVRSVGISDKGEIIAVWKCRGCHHQVMNEIPLDEFLEKIPLPSDLLERGVSDLAYRTALVVNSLQVMFSRFRKETHIEKPKEGRN